MKTNLNLKQNKTDVRELLELSHVKIDTILTFTNLTLDNTSLLDHVDYFKVWVFSKEKKIFKLLAIE